jgi:DNA topoisomerase I
MANLLLIESPGKLRKLAQILGNGWIIKASMGHVRELANDGEDALGFDLLGDRIDCRYEPRSPQARKILTDLRQAVKMAQQVYIATDPDREGETIGWHLQQALKLKNPYRVTYSEITPQAVRAAIAHPRHLDTNLVAAGRARDCLDKLVGYKGSKHVVWKLNNGAKSMGRVQSATLHLLCQREREILAFKPQHYWSIWVEYCLESGETFKAFYRAEGKPKAVTPVEPSDAPDEKAAPESDRITTQAEADRIVALARSHPHVVWSVEGKITQQSPPPPFITSSLQQAAGQRFKFSPDQTMKVAQTLYEAGLITYMRTDSVTLAESFCEAVRDYLQRHDPDNLPGNATHHRSRANAQDAHEAIRPTDINQTPDTLSLGGNEAKLYKLIWDRSIASQCAPVSLQKTRVMTHAGETAWEARGQVIAVAGYTRYWNNLSADHQLPRLDRGQLLPLKTAQADAKQTQPPPRYGEPKLVQLMERKGIGRPSTYAPTIKTLKDRGYAALSQGRLQPTDLGLDLDRALEQLLPDLIQPEFTAKMEAELDTIAAGRQDWERYLNTWHQQYFAPAIAAASQRIRLGQLAPGIPSTQANIQANVQANSQPSPTETLPLATKTRTTKTRTTKTKTAKTTQATTAKPKRTRAKGKTSSPADLTLEGIQATEPPYEGQDSILNAAAFRRETSPSSTTASAKTPAKAPAKASATRSTPQLFTCPKCQQNMAKIPSKSPKLKADHFLKCSMPACGAVMFWDPKTKRYEQPYGDRPIDPNAFTAHPCPVCSASLERYRYSKEGKEKVMLRCSILENRKQKCREVAYFEGKDFDGKTGFWSPLFGNLAPLGIMPQCDS